MRTLYQDLRYGARLLLGSAGFTAVAVLTLAIGIAANTTVFSWIDGVLLRPLPGVSDGRRLVVLELATSGWNGGSVNLSYNDYRFARENLSLLSGIAAHVMNTAFNVGEGENAQRTWGELVSGNYFAVLGVKALAGRVFLPEEFGEKPGGFPVAVIGERLWRGRFNADPGIVGRTVLVNRYPLTIVGVVPAEFRGTMPGLALDMWVPLMMTPQLTGASERIFQDGSRNYRSIARLKPGVTIERARTEVQAFLRRAVEQNPRANEGISATLLPVWKAHTGAQSLLLAPLQILMAACLVVLLIACANVANLQLARSIARQREFSVRLALGASRSRLVRQLLTESLILAGMGALLGVPLALWMGQSLAWLLPPVGLPIGFDIRLNGDILAFTILVCLASTLLSGMTPVLRSIRSDVNEALKEGGRSETSGSGSSRLRSLLVASEFALALVALIGAGLFIRSFQQIQAIDPGFDPTNVSIAHFQPSASGYSVEQCRRFCTQLRERLRSVPGILEVAFSNQPPLGFGQFPWMEIEPESYVPGRGENLKIYYDSVSTGYFRLMRIPQLEGRDFAEQDTVDAPPVIIVNESFARRFFEGRSPIGRKVKFLGASASVIGMVKDCKYHSLAEAAQPFVYLPLQQRYSRQRTIAWYVRGTITPDEAFMALRREGAAVDPGVALFDAMSLSEHMAASLYAQKVAASLLGVLAALSLLLAAVGLYSVTSYAVSQRTHEIGIRMAVGAQPFAVIRMVVGDGMVVAGAGLLAGIAVALGLTRLVSSMLVKVSGTDPVVFVVAPLFLAAIAVAASCIPARRATRVAPMSALRCQ
jgi:predicted permease